eukprot:TRINITY_DN74238_c0_g1_i1.p1 TRINITY_DN74238_c0_g1~~TRINITY_DN74238_c0_g1_i1.p1  ORF type:complete len:130 (-),score=17.09 TRINITY_DN74238_c0_g1_i1:303-692(-)
MAAEATREAFVELQGRLLETDSKLKQVLAQEQSHAADRYMASITLEEMEGLDAGVNVYQSIGRAFVLEPLDEVKAGEAAKIKQAEAAVAALQSSKAYLEKHLVEIQGNFKDLVGQLPASVAAGLPSPAL